MSFWQRVAPISALGFGRRERCVQSLWTKKPKSSRRACSTVSVVGEFVGIVFQLLHGRTVGGTADRRVIELTLTEPGAALLDLDPVVKIAHMVDEMGAEHGVPLVRGLSRLLHDLQVELGAREFGGCELCDQFRHEGTRGKPSGAYRCGLTGETLDQSEVSQLCVNFAAR